MCLPRLAYQTIFRLTQMTIKVAIPDLQPGWYGGMRHLATIRKGVNQLEELGVVDIARCPSLSKGDRYSEKKYSLTNLANFSCDIIRGLNVLNIPRPLSRFSEKSLGWIPDLQDIEKPEFFNSVEISRREKLREDYIKRNRAFIFSSNSALNVFKSMGYKNPLVAGILRFASDLSSLSPIRNLNTSCHGCEEFGFFYLPNQWWIHKNHEWVLKNYMDYQSSGGLAHLILTGKESDLRWPNYSADKILSRYKLSNVHRLGMVERQVQKYLFTNAIAVIQPSYYEGWSTTIEEAISCGTPIIASDIASNSEQLIDCKDATLINLNANSELVDALLAPPVRMANIEIHMRNAVRWKRFLDDLENVITLGDQMTSGGKGN